MDVPRNLHDDPTIPDSELLNRAIHPIHLTDNNEVSSGAFKNRSDPHISVDIASLSTPEETHRRWPGYAGVVQLATRIVRMVTPGVARNPTDNNPAHALIIHDFTLTNSKWKKVARKLAKACVWAIPPVGGCGKGS